MEYLQSGVGIKLDKIFNFDPKTFLTRFKLSNILNQCSIWKLKIWSNFCRPLIVNTPFRTHPNPFVQPKPAPIDMSEWYFFGLKSSPIPTGAQLKFSLTFSSEVKVTHLVDNSQPDNFDSVHRAFLYWDKNSESIFRPTEATYKANRWRSTPSPIMACLVSVPWWRTAASRAFFRDSEVTI